MVKRINGLFNILLFMLYNLFLEHFNLVREQSFFELTGFDLSIFVDLRKNREQKLYGNFLSHQHDTITFSLFQIRFDPKPWGEFFFNFGIIEALAKT